MEKIKSALKLIFRVLSFRATPEEFGRAGKEFLLTGLAITWVVGIGRWWDDPRVLPIPVRMGLGSVVYVFVLAAVLWVLAKPLMNRRTGYYEVAAFVAATSLPGIIYAFPIEAISPDAPASDYNVKALLFVAAYRVSLLIWFCYRILQLSFPGALVVTFLPISLISLGVVMAGMGHRVFDIMGGFREAFPPSAVEEVLTMIGCLSFLLAPVLGLWYVMACGQRWLDRRPKESHSSADP
jgi:hypothetical protein